MIRSTLTTLAALALAVPALAQDMTDPMIDTDGDGAYSLGEMQAAFPDMAAETFAELDTDADGLLSLEEVATATEAGLMPMTEG